MVGYLAVVGAAVVFSWGFTIVKAVDLPSPQLAMWRLLMGAAVLLVAIKLLRARWPRNWRFVVFAGLAMGVHQLLYMLATKGTSISIVTLLAALQPVMVVLLAQFLVGERFRWATFVWSLVALAGVGVVVQANLGEASRSLHGDLLAVANVIAFTGYFLAAKRARLEGASTLTLTASILLIALMVVAPVAIIQGLAKGGVETPSWGSLGLIAVLAIGSGNGHLLVNWAHDRVSASAASTILLVVPFLASLWAYLVHHEPLGPRHLVGIGLVCLAIEGTRRAQRKLLPSV